MVDITHKKTTLRTAQAQAVVMVSSEETITAIKQKNVPKGDVFEMAKTAGLLGVKRTSDMLPDCHPIPVEYTGIDYDISGLEITITLNVKTIYKTGVEVEAMHGASVVALTMYDMLKPIDKGVEIKNIRLVSKTGGKSDFVNKEKYRGLSAHVVVCSDTCSAGVKEDKSGKAIRNALENYELKSIDYEIIPDEPEEIIRVLSAATEREVDILIYTGGTGLSKRDVTPETLAPMLETRIPGIEEAIRSYGQDRTPYAMLSRSIVGVKNKTLVIAMPGSTAGARESMAAIFPEVMHVFKVFRGTSHEDV